MFYDMDIADGQQAWAWIHDWYEGILKKEGVSRQFIDTT